MLQWTNCHMHRCSSELQLNNRVWYTPALLTANLFVFFLVYLVKVQLQWLPNLRDKSIWRGLHLSHWFLIWFVFLLYYLHWLSFIPAVFIISQLDLIPINSWVFLVLYSKLRVLLISTSCWLFLDKIFFWILLMYIKD